MLLFGVTLITLGAVLPDLKEKFGLADQTAGTLFAILPFGILAGSVIFGYCCDHYGYKWVLIPSCLCIAAGLAGIGYSHTLLLLKISVFVFGLGGGCINGATNALVADISATNKSANLSLLGVFFAIGALGMPLLLGILQQSVAFETILLALALFTLLLAGAMLMLSFPPAKNIQSGNVFSILAALNKPFLLLISFFLFFQSSLEAVVHNWITSYLSQTLSFSPENALYMLTMNVVGMAVMRLLMGGLLRKIKDEQMLRVSMGILVLSSSLLYFATGQTMIMISVFLLGAGMAAGFPVMYAFVGKRYPRMSATAFSFVLVIALIGNMLINYGMGWVAENYGIRHLSIVIWIETVIMTLLCFLILPATREPINNKQ
jgi:fucose permease